MNTPTLKTDRLILRKFTEEDMDALFQILSDEEVNRFLPWYPAKSLEETRQFYAKRYALQYAQPQAYAYAICLKEDNFPSAISRSIWRKPMILAMDFARSSGTGASPQRRAKRL